MMWERMVRNGFPSSFPEFAHRVHEGLASERCFFLILLDQLNVFRHGIHGILERQLRLDGRGHVSFYGQLFLNVFARPTFVHQLLSEESNLLLGLCFRRLVGSLYSIQL